jgi:hypothetical protein
MSARPQTKLSKKQVPATKTGARKQVGTREKVKLARSGHKYIARQERSAKTVPGWKVAIQRQGKYMHKYFSDKQFGGKTKAFAAAKTWRDEVVAATSGVNYVLWRRNKMYPHNTSDIVGVGRYVVRYGRKKQIVWDAFWEDADGKRCGRRFFVATHGERRAKALAVAARRDAIEELRQELIRRGHSAK